jgi:hypothetical protein
MSSSLAMVSQSRVVIAKRSAAAVVPTSTVARVATVLVPVAVKRAISRPRDSSSTARSSSDKLVRFRWQSVGVGGSVQHHQHIELSRHPVLL